MTDSQKPNATISIEMLNESMQRNQLFVFKDSGKILFAGADLVWQSFSTHNRQKRPTRIADGEAPFVCKASDPSKK